MLTKEHESAHSTTEMNRFLIAVLLSILEVVSTHAETRQALVIGNSEYQPVTRLKNPDSDADLMELTNVHPALRFCTITLPNPRKSRTAPPD